MRLHTGWALTVLALGVLVVADGGAQELKAPERSEVPSFALRPATVTEGALLTDAGVDRSEALRVTAAERETGREVAGPTRDGAVVGARAGTVVESSAPLLATVQDRPRVGQSKALMIVGGAALVAGLIIGDDAGALLAVGGAVVGLYGLYQFVR